MDIFESAAGLVNIVKYLRRDSKALFVSEQFVCEIRVSRLPIGMCEMRKK
jgi:hypothetical protein